MIDNEFEANILKWYNFENDSNIVIIGHDKSVIDKCDILGSNVKEASYINKLDGEKADYLILYDAFNGGNIESITAELKQCKQVLCETGTILLINSNLLSMRCVANNGQVSGTGVIKQTLEKSIQNAGFDTYKFYYPMPSASDASIIFTDDYPFTQQNVGRIIGFERSVKPKYINDIKILEEIAKDDTCAFSNYCDSFLVEIKLQGELSEVRAVFYNNMRKSEYRLTTLIEKECVKKLPYSANSKIHVETIAKNINLLNEAGINCLDRVEDGFVISRYIDGYDTLDKKIADAMKASDDASVSDIFSSYVYGMLDKLQKVEPEKDVFEKYDVILPLEKKSKLSYVENGLLDLVFQNIFVIDNEFYAYDQEWHEENVPVEFILYRSIKYMPGITDEQRNHLYELADLSDYIKEFFELENKIQSGIIDGAYLNMYFNELKSYEMLSSGQSYSELVRDNKLQRELLDSEMLLYSTTRNRCEGLDATVAELNNQVLTMQHERNLAALETQKVLQSDEYNLGIKAVKLRKRFRLVFAFLRLVKKALKKMIVILKRVLKPWGKVAKKFYKRYVPKFFKRRIRNRIMFNDSLAHWLHETSISDYENSPNVDVLYRETGIDERVVRNLVSLDKSIGIHLHLYYTDLAEEFFNYFTHIPYRFDLYISVMDGVDVKSLNKLFKRLVNLDELKVERVPNSGRDFGPMFVQFADDLRKHDYIMHVHSKKSLRTGGEKYDWRRFMLDHLLGDTERVMKSFYLMNQMGMGMVYVDNYEEGCPYWANTWLNEAPLARDILGRMGMELKDEILQFPAGSMFWAREDALDPLFALDLTWEDFGYEEGRSDGTLAYVFERITAKVARNRGYNIAIYNVDESRYRENKGEQLFHYYFDMDVEAMCYIMRQYDIVTFDIFDTLITRKIYNPDDSFEIIQGKLNRRGISIEDYKKKRKDAEFRVRQKKNFAGDCDIHEIYDEFIETADVSKDIAEQVKQIEIDTEYDLVMPRYDMLRLFNMLKSFDCRIILISDMYLTKDMIARMLNKCGYSGWEELIVSNDVGVRKDNGTMWDYFFDKYPGVRTVHCGDNESSDIHRLAVRGKDTLYVMKGSKLNTMMKARYLMDGEELNPLESAVIGMPMNRVVANSPFAMAYKRFTSVIGSYYDFGYAAMAPVIFYFMLWLIKENKGKEEYLFAAREGHYLQKTFNIFAKYLDEAKEINNHYLYISRRAVTVMNIRSIEDVREIMKIKYVGTLRELLYYRLNFWHPGMQDSVIELPRDIDLVMPIIEQHFDEIKESAERERNAYLKYIDSLNLDFDNKDVTLIDLGYAGTAQYYLAKLLDKKIAGRYFAVQSKLKPLAIGCDVHSCFNKRIDEGDIDNNIIYKYSLFLEAFLTSPDGQFQYFKESDNGLEPQFLYEAGKAKQIEKLDEVFEGVKDYITSILELFGEDVLNIDIDRKYILRCYENCIYESKQFDSKLRELFVVEDMYCSNTILDTFGIINGRDLNDWTYD